jgi:hypothetical protein
MASVPRCARHRLGTAALAIVTLGLSACGGSHGSGSSALVTGSFVGAVPGTRLYVAVVAAAARSGAAVRPVRVYVCDGRNVNEWFPGQAANTVAMRSDSSKAEVDVTVHDADASGTIVLADGTSVRFRAGRATGIAGLYDSMLLPDGTVRGSSETGARLEGRRVGGPDRSGRFKYLGRYIEPNGKTTPWVSFSDARLIKKRPVESRIIVLSDGRRRGAFKRAFRSVFIGNSQPPA